MDKKQAIEELKEALGDWLNGQYAEFVDDKGLPDDEWEAVVNEVLHDMSVEAQEDFDWLDDDTRPSPAVLYPRGEPRDWLDDSTATYKPA